MQYQHAQNSFPCPPCMPQKIFTSMVAKTGTIMLAKVSYYPANKQTFSLFAHCSQEPWIKYSSQATVQNGNFCEILLDSLRRDRLLCPKVTMGLCWSCIKRMAADRLASLPCIFLWHFLELILGSRDGQALRRLFCSLLALSPVEKINKSLCFQGHASNRLTVNKEETRRVGRCCCTENTWFIWWNQGKILATFQLGVLTGKQVLWNLSALHQNPVSL